MKNVHPTAIIENGANIHKDAKIDAYAYVSANATIKKGVHVMQGAQICNKTTIEENTRIFSYAMVGSIPQDLKYNQGDDTSLFVGKNTTIREFATINVGTIGGGGITKIGDNVLVMNYVHIAHDCIVGNNVILANNATLAGHVSVGDFSVIGGLTPVHQFVSIGEGCMIAGASALSQDIPPFCLAEGNRAIVRSLNLTGLRRRFQKDDIQALQSAYKELFRSNKPLKENAQNILNQTQNDKVKIFCEFILNTKRGIPYERAKIDE